MIVPVKDGCDMSLWPVSFCSSRFVMIRAYLSSNQGRKNLSVHWTCASSVHKKTNDISWVHLSPETCEPSESTRMSHLCHILSPSIYWTDVFPLKSLELGGSSYLGYLRIISLLMGGISRVHPLPTGFLTLLPGMNHHPSSPLPRAPLLQLVLSSSNTGVIPGAGYPHSW